MLDEGVIIVIPARYESSRFPGKALAEIEGRPLIEHVYRRARAVRGIEAVLVATDDARIANAVESFGGVVALTASDLASGTDRVAAVAGQMRADIVVNLQGDEPMIDPRTIEAVIEPLREGGAIQMTTAAKRIEREQEMTDTNVVKVVADQSGFALYFSRSAIPHRRIGSQQPLYKHIGLYGYRRALLLEIADLAPTPLELSEGLEQLRVLESGHRIKVVETAYDSLSVDTLEQLERVRKRMRGAE